MSVLATVALYSLIVVIGALLGAMVVLWNQRPTQLVRFLAFAAGVMLGAAFFHMLPEAYEGGGWWAFALVPAGFVFLLVLERYLVAHAGEDLPGDHMSGSGRSPAQAGQVLGLTAFLGLSTHTLFDGIALGSAVEEGVGLMALLAIVAHKVPSALSLASILKTEGRSRSSILLLSVLYGLMVPAGALLYFAFDAVLRFESMAPKALAFSAGTFLYIAVSDLLPHVHRHGKDQPGRNVLALFVGLALMFGLARLMGHPAH
ncbi:ZIP family metal transporter [Myxococcus sp. CA051A]|uniref:ZIP family metal transporter n=1 Tax=Myxococcus llanfairpwllgwyngyllgogerychwyrndrobwllllantysiliogogogochensis TaxID=2590453 RepID=A0A540WMT3_9BACT|nr:MULTISPECIES: ZIP family metal transporter [Myxococcus]NTX00688.1 ZIP family metal transporter [Myxococcus sp. CA040A]NTX12607.1 ZIP family metal transporter [Myxococcus sp. CA056]NTX33626.1 ZIP family metal transporter [Myxococcus sp. CA033]NTX53482.1 ZIP family metal transporter [Myxococcus sp. CA039A]NTX59267.1 ZIP family metal transporter [Myxococcus sp. CA051A]